MKIDCNKLSIGQTGTQHICWESVSTFVASKTEAFIAILLQRRIGDTARKPKRLRKAEMLTS